MAGLVADKIIELNGGKPVGGVIFSSPLKDEFDYVLKSNEDINIEEVKKLL